MFEVITQTQPLDYQSLEILKEAYFKLVYVQHVYSFEDGVLCMLVYFSNTIYSCHTVGKWHKMHSRLPFSHGMTSVM